MADQSRRAGGSSSSLIKNETTTDYDEELDFFSDKFNPERALHSANIVVPYPDIKSFESVKSYEHAVQRRQQQSQKQQHNLKPDERRNQQIGSDSSHRIKTSTSQSLKECTTAERDSESSHRESRSHKRSSSQQQQHVSGSAKRNEKPFNISVKAQTSSLQNLPTSFEDRSYTLSRSHQGPSHSLPRTSRMEKQSQWHESVQSEGKSHTSSRSHERSSNYRSSEKFIWSREKSTSSKTGKHFNQSTSRDVTYSSSSTLGTSRSTSSRSAEKPDFELPFSASTKRSEKLYHESSRRHERSSSYDQTSSRIDEIPAMGLELSSSSSNYERSSEKTIQSQDRPFYYISRIKDKHFHVASRQDEEPSTSYSAISERQELYSKIKVPKSENVTETVNPQFDAQKIQIPSGQADNSSLKKNTSKSSKKRNVFTRMEAVSGPLLVLKRCVQERLQVRVMTRGAMLVRGICRGYIIAFDKHFNMAMMDVDEIYRRPKVLGKVKAKRSLKLLAAQETLQREREEYLAKWKKEEQDISKANSSLQDLSIKSEVEWKDQKLIIDISQPQEGLCEFDMDLSFDHLHSLDQSSKPISECPTSSSVEARGDAVPQPQSSQKEMEMSDKRLSKSVLAKLRKLQSVYEDLKAPMSPFEREALMLGIPDENVDHRHINQLFIRGENVVSVSIIEDF